jgi:glyoxylase-like metal-dependent hydrolase (beta-lactamase superfamily II)
MLEEIKKLTPNPVTRVILTHSDRDHVNGLAGFPKGLTIVAQAQCKKEMAEAFKDPALLELREYMPTQVFDDSLDLKINQEPIRLLHFGPAHTSGDTVVLFPTEKVAFIGDLAFIGRDPLVHRQKGGTSLGYAATLKKIIELGAETYVSGHNDPLTTADLQGLLSAIKEKQAKVKALIAEGKSLEDIKAAFGIADQAGATAGRRFPSLVEVIYFDLTGKRNAQATAATAAGAKYRFRHRSGA